MPRKIPKFKLKQSGGSTASRDGVIGAVVRPPILGVVLVSALAQSKKVSKPQTVVKLFAANSLEELSDQIRIASRR